MAFKHEIISMSLLQLRAKQTNTKETSQVNKENTYPDYTNNDVGPQAL